MRLIQSILNIKDTFSEKKNRKKGLNKTSQAIVVKKYYTTNGNPKFKAYCERGKLITDDAGISRMSGFINAANLLVAKFCNEDQERYGTIEARSWEGWYIMSGYPDKPMYVFTRLPRDYSPSDYDQSAWDIYYLGKD